MHATGFAVVVVVVVVVVVHIRVKLNGIRSLGNSNVYKLVFYVLPKQVKKKGKLYVYYTIRRSQLIEESHLGFKIRSFFR